VTAAILLAHAGDGLVRADPFDRLANDCEPKRIFILFSGDLPGARPVRDGLGARGDP
jgi:hypothetical protein